METFVEEEARRARQKAIFDARNNTRGKRLSEIAKEYGITVERVRQILKNQAREETMAAIRDGSLDIDLSAEGWNRSAVTIWTEWVREHYHPDVWSYFLGPRNSQHAILQEAIPVDLRDLQKQPLAVE